MDVEIQEQYTPDVMPVIALTAEIAGNDYQSMPVGKMLEALAKCREAVKALAGVESSLRGEQDRIEKALVDKAEREGVENFKGHGLTVSVENKLRARYDPARWDELVKWAVANGMTHLIQRRLNDSHFREMIENGDAIPDAVTMEAYTTLSVKSLPGGGR
jgi:hypothetical protein